MRGEEKKNRRSSSNGNSGSEINGQEYRYGKNGISKSRSLGIIILILGMFLFQVSVFVFENSCSGISYSHTVRTSFSTTNFALSI